MPSDRQAKQADRAVGSRVCDMEHLSLYFERTAYPVGAQKYRHAEAGYLFAFVRGCV